MLNIVFTHYNKKEVEPTLLEWGMPEVKIPNGAKDEVEARILYGDVEGNNYNRFRYFYNFFIHGFHKNTVKFYSVNEIPSLDKPFAYVYPIHIFNHNLYKLYTEKLFYIPDKVIRDIQNKRAKLMFISDEGEEINDIKLKMLEYQTKNYNISPSSVVFLSCNYLIEEILKEKGYIGIYYNPWQFSAARFMTAHYNFIKTKCNILEDKLRDKKFLCFNRNNHAHRAYLVERLLELGIDKESIITYGNIGNNIYFWKEHKLLNSKIPLLHDEKQLHVNTPIDINFDAHNQCYFNIVTETYFEQNSNKTVFFSEKIFKPIQCLQPFLLVGQVNGLKQLKKMGYKTFDQFINEDYDSIDDSIPRIEAIIKEIVRLNSISNEHLSNMLYQMFPILEHNFCNHAKLIQEYYYAEIIVNKIYETWQ